MRTVLHISDDEFKVDAFMLRNLFRVSRGVWPLDLHLDRGDGTIEIWHYELGREPEPHALLITNGHCGCP